MAAGTVIGMPDYFRLTRGGMDVPMLPYMLNYAISYIFWAAITPAVLWLGRRWRFTPGHLASAIPVHLAAAIVASAIHTTLHAIIGTSLWATMGDWSWGEAWGLYHMPTYILYRMPITTFLYMVILAAGYGMDYQRQLRHREVMYERLEKNHARTELSALRYQLQPHFLFNALHSVVALVRRKDNEKAIRMLTSLSDLLRYSLVNIKRHEVSLEEEARFLNMYLDIERVRFADRLQVELDIPPDTIDALVPSFTLQPIVENAIRHGLSNEIGGGKIVVRARTLGKSLTLTVTDNGCGLPRPIDPAHSNGTGLSVTYNRLKTLYGEHCDMNIRNCEGGGTEVALSIPFHLTPANVLEQGSTHE
jgi:signal transduction histidine kinase